MHKTLFATASIVALLAPFTASAHMMQQNYGYPGYPGYGYPYQYQYPYYNNYDYTYPAPTCGITYTSAYGGYGYGTQAITLSWWSANATSASISPSVGTVNTSGTRTVYPSGSTTYTLTVSGQGGTRTCSVNYVQQYNNPQYQYYYPQYQYYYPQYYYMYPQYQYSYQYGYLY